MLIAEGWYPHSEPEALTGRHTVSEVLALAEWRGMKAVRVQVGTGAETFRWIAGEWICTA